MKCKNPNGVDAHVADINVDNDTAVVDVALVAIIAIVFASDNVFVASDDG